MSERSFRGFNPQSVMAISLSEIIDELIFVMADIQDHSGVRRYEARIANLRQLQYALRLTAPPLSPA